MKLCWENLDKIRLVKGGNLKIGSSIYILKDACKNCGDSFFATKRYINGKVVVTDYCSKRCVKAGKKLSINHKLKLIGSHMGQNSGRYKGGVIKLNIALYDTYAHQFPPNFEEVRIYMWMLDAVVYKTLQVRCHNSDCRKWFKPTLVDVVRRLQAYNGAITGEQCFYCSDECKRVCPVFGKQKYREGEAPDYSRPGQKQWREMVLERDNYTCQKCGFHSPTGKGLVAHHMEPVIQNPIESMDVDIGITLCIPCDKEVHKLPGCSPYELRCKK